MAAGLIQLMGTVACKREAIAIAHGGIVDGIAQAAGLANDGRRAVTAGDHLGQATGLTLGGHDERVRACVDFLRQSRLKADVSAYAARVTSAQIGEETLILVLAAAQDDQLDATVHQTIGHALHQSKPFMPTMRLTMAKTGLPS